MNRTFPSILLALATACAAAPADPGDKGHTHDAAAGKEDRWDWRNRPERFDGEFDYFLEDLPLSGTAEREAWPSTYWPTYEDSINTRWQSGELSPAQKYDRAFNDWTPSEDFHSLRPFDRSNPVPGEDWDEAYYDQLGPLATHISRNMGNGRDREMAIEAGGRPEDDWAVETWWGLCHAWVPAALLEDRPLRAVTYNGVTFETGDMEALLIAAYNRSGADMIGGRCNLGNDEDSEVERDEHGRAVNVDCRDTNPGSLHVILTNYLGMQSRGFAMDRTYDYEVWNQPISGYEITKQEEIDIARANELLGLTGDSYSYNEDAAFLYDVKVSVKWITESHASKVPSDTARYTRTDRLSYILEVDADGKIIGGEWYGSSRNRHPDFLWNPRRITRSSVPSLNIDDVRMLIEMSRAPEVPDTPEEGALVADGQGGIAIPDNESMGVTSGATIEGGTGVVGAVSVDLAIGHTYVGDLLIELEHDGITRTVHNREGGSADDIRRTIDVIGFEGSDPNGDWTLRVSDNASRDVGTLESWSLTLVTEDGTPTEPTEPSAERFEGQGGVAIPDNDPEGISSTANVTATEGTVTVEAAITHTYVGDLEVTVAHGERSWTLHSREGGSDDDLALSVTLDATGNAFEGDPSGEWVLTVSDNANVDTGTIDGWAVVVAH